MGCTSGPVASKLRAYLIKFGTPSKKGIASGSASVPVKPLLVSHAANSGSAMGAAPGKSVRRPKSISIQCCFMNRIGWGAWPC